MFKLLSQFTLFIACPTAIALGTWILTDYSSRPGESDVVANNLNEIEHIAGHNFSQTRSSPTLFLFYHPHCPCTSSTVRNLLRLSSRFSTDVELLAIAYCANDEPDAWIESPLTDSLQGIENSNVLIDRGGKACERFGIKTSGHALLYDSQGQLVFSGGITPSRGHEGDCDASADLLEKINTQSGESRHWPVFGCPFFLAGELQQ